MKKVASTEEYTIFQRRDGRYAVKGADKAPINGDEKVKILLQHELIEAVLPKEPEPEAETEAETDEAAVEGDEAAAAEEAAEEAPAEESAEEEAPVEEAAADEAPAADEDASDEEKS